MIVSAGVLDNTVIKTDVAIVGAGAAGLSLASALKRNVVVIESGNFGVDGDADIALAASTSGEPMNTVSLSRRTIGGATRFWTGRCGEMAPIDFDKRPWVDHSGWPVEFANFAPYYQEAWRILGIPTPEETFSEHLARLKRSLPLSPDLAPQLWQFAFAAPETPWNLGHYFLDAFRTPGKTLLCEADAIGLQSEGRTVTGVRIVDRRGRSMLVEARQVVLASGCIETNRFLLDALDDAPELLRPVEKWLGRGFQQHLLVQAGTVAPSGTSSRKLQRSLNRFRRRPARSYEVGLTLQPELMRRQELSNISAVFRYAPVWPRSLTALPQLALAKLRGREPVFAAPRISVELSVEQNVDWESRITLGRKTDRNGTRRADVHWRMNSLERRTTLAMIGVLAGWLKSSGLGTLTSDSSITEGDIPHELMRDSLHHLGGTRMSDGPADGVVDSNLFVHGSANLAILGGCVFPTGGHVNPTFTIIALSLRLAEFLGAQPG